MSREHYFEQSTLEKVIDFFAFNKIVFRYNELKDVIELSEKGKEWVHIDDRKINDILLLIVDSTNDLKKEIKTINKLRLYIENSYVSPDYNPIKVFFDNLIYDGEDHVGNIIDCLKLKGNEIDFNNSIIDTRDYVIKYIRIWLRGCVSSIYSDKGNQVMLLLVGEQGIYKTSFINNLIPPHLKDNLYSGHIIPNLKENFTCDLLAEKYLINIDDQVEELLGQRFQEIKSVITCDYVNNRKVFRRDARRRKRIANFAGSANSRNLFADSENRRYLTVDLESISLTEMLDVDINQVWAQARTEYFQGMQFHFDKNDIEIFNAINDGFATKSIEQEFLPILFEPGEVENPLVCYMQFSEIFKVIRKVTQTNISMQKLTNAWKKLKYPNRISKRIKGVAYPIYVYPVKKKYTEDGTDIHYDVDNLYI